MVTSRIRTAALLLGLLAACEASTAPTPVGVATVEVKPETAELPVGETLQLQALVRDEAENLAEPTGLFWSSEEPAIASVSEQGVVTAHSAGDVRVAASVAGVSGVVSVTVVPAPVSSVSITPSRSELEIGDEVELTAAARSAAGELLSGRAVAWSSATPAVAEVDADGRVVAVSAGSAEIRATVEGVVATAAIEVLPLRIARLEITPSAAAMVVGDTLRFGVTGVDAEGNEAPVEGAVWSSSDPEVVTVSSTGLAAAAALGTATITVRVGESSASVGIGVGLTPVATVEVSPDSLTLATGEEGALAATLRAGDGTEINGRDVVWRSEDEEIATVDVEGIVVGRTPGRTSIIASSERKSGTAIVVVVPKPVASVTVEPSRLTLTEGEASPLTAEARAADGSAIPGATIRWSSGDDDVATVDASGTVSGLAPGKVTITAASEGRSGTAEVEVLPVPVATVEVTPSSLTLTEGERGTLTVVLRSAGGDVLTDRPVKWSSDKGDIASVDDEGEVRGRRAGVASITATSEGRSASATVRVVRKPASIVIVSGDEQSGFPGSTLPDALVVRVVDASGREIEGVTVSWTTNSGSLTPERSSTARDGTTSAAWTVGSGFSRTATASVEGLAPVTFRAYYLGWSEDDEDDE